MRLLPVLRWTMDCLTCACRRNESLQVVAYVSERLQGHHLKIREVSYFRRGGRGLKLDTRVMFMLTENSCAKRQWGWGCSGRHLRWLRG